MNGMCALEERRGEKKKGKKKKKFSASLRMHEGWLKLIFWVLFSFNQPDTVSMILRNIWFIVQVKLVYLNLLGFLSNNLLDTTFFLPCNKLVKIVNTIILICSYLYILCEAKFSCTKFKGLFWSASIWA